MSENNSTGMKSNDWGCVVLILLIVVPVAFFTFAPNRSTGGASQPNNPNGDAIGACIVAEKFVRERLRSPSTAEFPPGTSQCRTSHNGGVWTVRSYVDAQNAFGAMLRSDYVVVTRYNGNDNWSLVEIDIAGR